MTGTAKSVARSVPTGFFSFDDGCAHDIDSENRADSPLRQSGLVSLLPTDFVLKLSVVRWYILKVI